MSPFKTTCPECRRAVSTRRPLSSMSVAAVNSECRLTVVRLSFIWSTSATIARSVPLINRRWSHQSVNSHSQDHHHNGDRAARRPYILCSICVHSFEEGFGESRATVRGITSHQSQPRCSQMCSIDILIDLQPFSCNLKVNLDNLEIRDRPISIR